MLDSHAQGSDTARPAGEGGAVPPAPEAARPPIAPPPPAADAPPATVPVEEASDVQKAAQVLDTLQPEPELPTHSFYAKQFPMSWAGVYEKALNDPLIHDLNSEIAVLRTLLARYLERCDKKSKELTKERGTEVVVLPDMDSVARVCEGIGRNVDRMIGKKNVLTTKGAREFAAAVAKAVFEEIGRENPRAALRLVERIRSIGPTSAKDIRDVPSGRPASGRKVG